MKKLLFSTIVLTLLGLLFVFEASTAESLATYGHQYHFLRQQSMWLGVGLVALIVAALTPLQLLQKTSPIWYGLGILLLILVLIPGIGREFNGARRWIGIGSITVVQPIELVKFCVTVFFASWMSKHQKLVPFLFLSGLPIGLVLLQPDLGSTLILFAVTFGMYFLAGGNLKFLGITTAGALLFFAIAVGTSSYRMQRVTTYLNPELDPLGAGFHIRQITLALGRGGLLGQGIGNSQQKLAYIPEPSSDSIFAITAEEVGFVGSLFIITLYALYIHAAISIAKSQKKNRFNYLIATGITIWFAAQTLLNLAAIVALVPLTGLPLPLFSYGGSSLVMILFATGILLRLSLVKKK
jgi:cell division protein FtsW